VLYLIYDSKHTPSYRELGELLGIKSTNAVAEHIRALRLKGYLEIPTRPTARNYRLTPAAEVYLTKRHGKVPNPSLVAKAVAPSPADIRKMASSYRDAANQLDEIANQLELSPP